MNWKDLKEEKCPKCGAHLSKGIAYYCNFCSFSISFGKAYDIVGKPTDLNKLASDLLKRNK
jgi:hypothetical protein